MEIYNTLSRKTEDFTPENPARIYSCGPTVYNYAHIGNLSSYIYADTLRRAINLSGAKTKHVMNITDIDDKTIAKSKEEYSRLEPMDALKALTEKYELKFYEDMKEIGNDVTAITFDRATDNIREIQDYIREIIKRGEAYIADDGIYFSISDYEKHGNKYGVLSNVSVGKSRTDNDEYDKDNAQDFALWKIAKDGEPSWDFEVESKNLNGRPGWHIECSVMSTKNLGQPFDVHTGGVDLIFPHHENEIAQCGGDLAKEFFHSEHLLVDGKKMSKSANNFYTLQDLKDKGYTGMDFRMMVLQSHYKSPTNFSWDNLESAKQRLLSWKNYANLCYQNDKINENPNNEEFADFLDSAKEKIMKNLQTPEVLMLIDQIFTHLSKSYSLNNLNSVIDFIDNNLGLKIRETIYDISDEEKNMISLREKARADKNWQESDNLRDALLARKIELKDTPNGTLWLRK